MLGNRTSGPQGVLLWTRPAYPVLRVAGQPLETLGLVLPQHPLAMMAVRRKSAVWGLLKGVPLMSQNTKAFPL